MLEGVITAVITPFFNDGALNHSAFEQLVERQIAAGIHGLTPCGTTGESPTLETAEQEWLIEATVKLAAGRCKVLAGTGSNNTAKTIAMTRFAEKVGADAALLVTPYYNKPTEEGLFRHVQAVHDATSIPLVLYNIPGRAVVNMSDSLIARMAELPRVVGVKDATGDLARVSSLRHKVGAEFLQLSGEDMTALAFYAQGGCGVVSVVSNIVPEQCVALYNNWLAGRNDRALAIQDVLTPLISAMFVETNPAPVKFAAALLNLCQPALRLPLVIPQPETQQRIEQAMKQAGLL